MRSIIKYQEELNEGFLRGIGGDFKDGITFLGFGDSLKSLFSDYEASYKILKNKIADIEYFINQNSFKGHTGSFIKFLNKMSFWRFYFILDDSTYNNIVNSIKNNSLDSIYVDTNFSKRVIKKMYDAKSNKELLATPQLYLSRVDNIVSLCKKHKTSPKILSNIMNIFTQGTIDLEYIIRKIIRYNE